ncbi:hypothetical protein [Rhodococcus sp. IEGM 1330]|uniref:hypothetical protein n=1 Tax=Rhodococcus sp. IEGM 1330 TaxID=3082225 RepID=UPI002954FE88|nr:hypothetical protein [Rhodococcus sp. IEGM 1330]MDV8022288.1 hypothetical protein [Rhodococcus sp. IEGM 1330]
MKTWSEMTYDEQRNALGLWQPTPGFHFQRFARSVGAAFGRLAVSYRELMGAHTVDVKTAYDRASDYALAGSKEAK